MADVPSCLTPGNDTYMPVGEMVFEILFGVKEKEEWDKFMILHLKHFPLFEETHISWEQVIVRIEMRELHGVWNLPAQVGDRGTLYL